jgi:peptidoglycan hydrolase-like protein with peptidoglycan-binding domain
MENRLLSFSEFESVYESYGFINEAEVAEKPTFTPDKLAVSSDDLLSLFGGDNKKQNEALKPGVFTVIKKGETSDRVKLVQDALGMKDFGKYNGVFGEETEKAVKAFQDKHKLAVDGKVGTQTLTKMLELKGDKTPEKTIETRYIIKTVSDAKKSGIDPRLLEIYDITIVNNGKREYVILIPKANTQKKTEQLISDGKGVFDWLKAGLNAAGKALVYTATGLAIIPFEMAKAFISGTISAAKFVVGGAVYVLGAAVQGLALVSKWLAAKGSAVYAKSSSAANDLWKGFCTGLAYTAGKLKDGVAALAAFGNGVVSAAKTIGYTLTGLALATWKGLGSALSPVVNGIVQAAKDGKAFLAASGSWIAKNFKDGAKAFANTINQGWQAAKTGVTTAYNASKNALKSAGNEVAAAANSAANAVGSFFSDMYNSGKKFWESEGASFFGEELFESIDSVWPELDFSIAE